MVYDGGALALMDRPIDRWGSRSVGVGVAGGTQGVVHASAVDPFFKAAAAGPKTAAVRRALLAWIK